jgi:hypothetical protein
MTRIRVKLGAAEVEVEADPERLLEAVEMIPELMKCLPQQAGSKYPGNPETSNEMAETRSISSPSDLPKVTLVKSDSLADIIGKLFADPWGRDRRKLSDVREALQTYGLNYPKQSVAVALLRLAKTGKIRRFKGEDGEFVYTASMTVMSQPQQLPSEPSLDATN